MDIHKPKPWHGVREFLKEYVIIVVGVLTALGAEQGVEWLHWRHLAAKAETDLAAGMQPNLINAVVYLAIEPCQRGRIAELAHALTQPGADWRANPMPSTAGLEVRAIPWVYAGIGRLWSHAPWETAEASGVLNHMPRDRVNGYAGLYRRVEVMRAVQTQENTAATHLAALAYDRKLTDAEKAGYLNLLSELDATQGAAGAAIILREAHALGVDPPPGEVAAQMKLWRDRAGGCVTDVKLPLG